jgi:hypothetical protein
VGSCLYCETEPNQEVWQFRIAAGYPDRSFLIQLESWEAALKSGFIPLHNGKTPQALDRVVIFQVLTPHVEMEKTLPAVPERPWDEQSDADFWAGNFRRAMYFERRVLDRPDDWGDMEFMKLKREVALATTAQTVRMKVADLGQRADPDSVVSRLMQRVAALRRGEPVIELEPDAETVEPTG